MRAVGRKLLVFVLFLVAVSTFFIGINWGLPSRSADPILFGGRRPWAGAEIMQLAGAWDEGGQRGADIAMHPLGGRDQPIFLTNTDAKRAEIIRRFRLYSNQPDEMITFRSLARMKPGKLDLDPRLYQYGGLWIYPIGGFLKLASLAGLVTLRTDLAFYLDHPEAFARFYLVARTYSALWGLLGFFVVFAIGKDWSGKFLVGITSAAMYASMPVVVNAAHEAKPHLAGAVLTLLTIWSAMRYVRAGQNKWWILAAIFAGMAVGMVLTGYAAFAVLPVMFVLRPMAWPRRAVMSICAGAVGTAVFLVTNPYLPYDLLFNRTALQSNVGNYGTFYRPGISLPAITASARFLVEGMSIAPALVGTIGVLTLTFYNRNLLLKSSGLLLAAPAVLVLIQFVLLAEGKAAEYARFAVTFDIILAISAGALIDLLRLNPREKGLLASLLVAGTLFYGCRYDINALLDNRIDSSRRLATAQIDRLSPQADVLAVWAEPAPYCMPAVDLFAWKIVLLPRGAQPAMVNSNIGVLAVRPVDRAVTEIGNVPRPTSPISWANKPFELTLFPAMAHR